MRQLTKHITDSTSTWSRRQLVSAASVWGGAGLIAGSSWNTTAVAQPAGEKPTRNFRFEDVVDRARALAETPFDDAHDAEWPELAALDYDDYRKIRFKEEARKSLTGGKFQLDLFHRGNLFVRRVGINLLRNGEPTPLPYRHEDFDFDDLVLAPQPDTLGFAGFRIRTPLNRPDVFDELIVFLGASYFRFLGRDQRYGLSARAFAINAGVPMQEEEFPFFREFWIEDGPADQNHLNVMGLLDSPSVAGAFAFSVHPGVHTAIDVTATVLARRTVTTAGVAPLTSMYYTGASGPREADLFRAEVHDSDGLMMRSGDEFTWRPLRNPLDNELSLYPVDQPKGFGLLQRNRDFDQYQDLEATYELRPSYWVVPQGEWSAGAVQLSELTTATETQDNIVACFRPASPLEPLKPTTWRYRIEAMTDGSEIHALATASRTLISDLARANGGPPSGSRLYVIDFTSHDIDYWEKALDQFDLVVESSRGEATGARLRWNPNGPGIRAMFIARAEPGVTAEFTARLMRGDHPFSETWLHRWTRAAT
ncbi:MAG: glucan biosynthesis protein [Hyphomicrobiales bacterium]|nr:glucan biosynthesis protein [Hyphomicrobiales bacterium]